MLLTGDATARRCERSSGDTVAGAARLKAELAPKARGEFQDGGSAALHPSWQVRLYYSRHLAPSGPLHNSRSAATTASRM